MTFWKRVFYYVPKRLKSKLDNRWRLGAFLRVTPGSDKKYISTSNGTLNRDQLSEWYLPVDGKVAELLGSLGFKAATTPMARRRSAPVSKNTSILTCGNIGHR